MKSISAFLLLLCSNPAFATNYVGSNMGGANLVLANGDTVTGVFTNVGLFSVPAGVRAQVVGNAELEVFATTVTITGQLEAMGMGSYGGNAVPTSGLNGLPGQGMGPGQGGLPGPCVHGGGGGGGGYGGAGGRGSYYFAPNTAQGGPAYGAVADLTSFMGSGGGSGGSGCTDPSGRGGAGGGSIYLAADTITVDGMIKAAGGKGAGARGSSGGGGGGAGGTIILDATTVNGSGILDVRGGRGGNTEQGVGGLAGGGGGGAGGRIKVFYTTLNAVYSYRAQGGARGLDQSGGYALVGAAGASGTIHN